MKDKSSWILNGGRNVLVVLVVFAQFRESAVWDLSSTPPEGTVSFVNDTRFGRSAQSFYELLTKDRKYNSRGSQFSRNGDTLTREIRIKQGRLKGFVKEFKNRKLKNVDVYWGIPYAAPPIKGMRFMPPGSPPTWEDVRVFDAFGPACPQTPPDLTREPYKTMNAGYYNRLKGLVPFLSNQSEDCLYLNVYAPAREDKKLQKRFPVVVYVHGESFEWNSGNPYDGSILASYGNVVVVTINFRLGILGFLRPGLSEHTVSNFGLLDQIAALQWIKDNIEEFGGDPSSVTLMGHGTGAACINFLMVSPVSTASQGLFHKAILLSGTALSDWALTRNPLQFTIQVAEALNCPLIDTNDQLSNCLRKKRLSEIMGVKVTVPEFQTPFGPIVDGLVVPNAPHQVMGVYQNLFTSYDLLYGISEWETYHSLDPVSLTYGMLEGERNEFLRKYMHSRYEALPFFALATTLSEYLDWGKGIPLAKSAAEQHRDLVLDLMSDARFAAPVLQMAVYHSKINPKSYFYVFKHKSKMGEFAGSERSVFGEEIPYVFGVPIINEESPLAHHKFSISEQLLSEAILTYFTNFAKTGNPNAPRRLEYLTQGPKEWQKYDLYWPEYDSENQSYLALEIPPYIDHRYRYQMTQFWNEILPDLLNNPTKVKQRKPETRYEENNRNSFDAYHNSGYVNSKKSEDSGVYGTVRMSPREFSRKRIEEDTFPSYKQMDRPPEDREVVNNNREETQASSIPYLVAVTVCLLLLNGVGLGYYFYKKRRTNGVVTKNDKESVYSAVSEERKTETRNDKTGRTCFGTSAEGHARFGKWIRREILEKCSKKTPKESGRSLKSETVSLESTKVTQFPKPILKNARRSNEDLKAIPKKVEKVSVAVDATPSSRGPSVLQQTPIEITKSLDRGLLKIRSQDLQAKGSRNSVSLQTLPTGRDVRFTSAEVIELRPATPSGVSLMRSFSLKNPKDINVTSRDSTEVEENSRIDPLENIQKRNFPKVLPDFPESKAMMRLSFPQSSFSSSSDCHRNKLNPPPPPPPRVSTLKSKPSEGQSGEKSDDSEFDDKSDSSKASVVVNPRQKTRDRPSIVIQPKIGPKKSGEKPRSKVPHVHLQNSQKFSEVPSKISDPEDQSNKS